MITLNVLTNGAVKVINGTLNAKKFNVTFTQALLDALKDKQEEFELVDNMEEFETWTKEVEEILKTETTDIVETACSDLKFNQNTGMYYMIVENEISNTPVPEALVNIIIESIDKDLSPLPLIKFWVRLLRDEKLTPSKIENVIGYITATIVDDEEVTELIKKHGYTYDVAKLRATYNDVMITAEGIVLTYKYARLVTEGWTIDPETNKAIKKPLFDKAADTIDPITGVRTVGKTTMPEYVEELTFLPPVMNLRGDAFICGDDEGHIIKVGEVHKLDSWDKVDCTDHRSCLPGLHVGGRAYVHGYKSLNCQLLNCFVDPSMIGAVCGIDRGGDGAMRVR